MHTVITSSAGVLSLLSELEPQVKIFALNRLNQLVNDFWAEIAESVTHIEELSEQESFPERELASLVVSKVYYHLGSFNDSLTYALGAGQKFDVNGTTEYIETMLSVCIDRYTELRVKQFDNSLGEGELIDPRLETIVMRMFDRCLADKRYKQAIGIAFETRRIDVLEIALYKADDMADTLAYCLKITLQFVTSPRFRTKVLELLVATYEKLEVPDYISICQCLIFLDKPQATAEILETLAKGPNDDRLIAYQIAFDLYESATQHFLRKVQETLKGSNPETRFPVATSASKVTENKGAHSEPDNEATQPAAKFSVPVQETGEEGKSELVNSSMGEEEQESLLMDVGGLGVEAAALSKGVESRAVAEGASDGPSVVASGNDDDVEQKRSEACVGVVTAVLEDPGWVQHLRAICVILGGEKTIALHQEFLIRNNNSDLQILKNTKESGRNSITHNATVLCNGLMHFGTTSDVFLRENLDWLKRASNWAKFTATASLGLLHYGHEKEALNLMSSYLPKDSSGTYAEGGGLFAIGLIHANHGENVIDYLSQELRSNSSEIVRHGGCLGLGLAAMGTENEYVYDLLKENLMTRDDAVIGEAAGLAMGLVMVGSRSSIAIEDMTTYARDTQHEKIQRGLALGISLLMYGQLEEADTLIEDLCRDKDPLIRRSGMFTIAMAYCGSSNNKAIRKLLHDAVSDVDDDVRRAAVTSLGFILFRTPEQCPHVVSLLSESFNPHVRCGSAMALGIACAGTGNKEALAIIEPMITDSIPFVQQAALVASALILIQHSEAINSKVAFYRQHYAKIVADKHEHNITKFGAILAQGVIDAGGLNMDLKMPKMEFRSNAKPSLYSYPKPLKKEKETLKEKVATAVLSVTAKAKAKERRKTLTEEHMEVETNEKPAEGEESSIAMDTESSVEEKTVAVESASGDKATAKTKPSKEEKTAADGLPEKTEVNKPPEKTEADKPTDKTEALVAEKPEPSFQLLSNPARVLPQQLKVLVLEESCRYKPFKPISVGGIIMLRDTLTEGEPEDLIEPLNVVVPGREEEDGDEPEPPEPFEWTDE